jgi:hypothetical protein
MGQYLDHLDAVQPADVTLGDVADALDERIAETPGFQHASQTAYWGPDTLASYLAAAAWWPLDAPPRFAMPSLRQMCMGIATPVGTHAQTADELLLSVAQRCAQWLESEGRDVQRPNETPEERRRRKAREGMSRHRAAVRGDEGAAARVRELHAAYIAACQRRKAAAAAHDDEVAAAKAAWESAKRGLAGAPPEAPAA